MGFFKHRRFNHKSLNQGCFGKLREDRKLPGKGHTHFLPLLSIISSTPWKKVSTNLSS